MKPIRKNASILDRCIHRIARSIVALFERLPWRTSRSVAACLGRVWWMSGCGGRKERGLRNIRRAFPRLSHAQARRVMRTSCRSVLMAIADTLQFRRRMLEGQWREIINVNGLDRLESAHRQSGVIFVSAHSGCWEVMGLVLPSLGFPILSVARAVPHPILNEYLRHLRQTGGQKIIDKHGALRRIVGELREGRNVAFLIDQDARRDGVFVDFMGRPSSFHTSVARLSMKTESPVVFVHIRSVGNPPTFRIEVSDIVWPRREADAEAEIYRITQRLADDAEKVIREHPEEWLWTQKLWKTYPGKFSEGKAPMPGVLKRQ